MSFRTVALITASIVISMAGVASVTTDAYATAPHHTTKLHHHHHYKPGPPKHPGQVQHKRTPAANSSKE